MAKPDSFVSQTSERLAVWDHRRSPGCADSRLPAPRPPWLPFNTDSHYPPRHSDRFNGLFYDGHVQSLRQSELRVHNFREPGSAPPLNDYPGE